MAHYVNIINGMTSCADNDLQGLASDLVNESGIVGTDHYLVEETSPASKDVKVNTGKAWVRKDYTDSESDILRTELTASDTITISDNISGSTRIDAIVIDVDFGASPDATASNVATLTAVEGTPAGSPTAPTDADIQTALGANHGFLRLADVTVESGFTSIVDADIDDTRVYTQVKSENVGMLNKTLRAFTDYDKSETAETSGATWVDWDISAIVPTNTYAVDVKLVMKDDRIDSYIGVRPNGGNQNQTLVLRVGETAGTERYYAYGTIPVNQDLTAGQTIEYIINDPGGSAVVEASFVITAYYTK